MKILGKYPSLRLRRIRKSSWIRRLVSENNLSVNDLILPIFIREGKNKVETIKSMPGINRYTVDRIDQVVSKACKLKIPLIALFPYTWCRKQDARTFEEAKETFWGIQIYTCESCCPYG